jgi:hypothetical protein
MTFVCFMYESKCNLDIGVHQQELVLSAQCYVVSHYACRYS